MDRIKNYYVLAKPGIVYGNSLALVGSFLLGRGMQDRIVSVESALLLLATITGASLVIAAACVGNNILEVATDAKMKRTSRRPLVNGAITPSAARLYMLTLLLVGTGLLAIYTNTYAVMAALAGYISYVLLYTPLKQVTYHSTLIGSIPGAMPPLIGYTAATATVDIVAGLLFISMVFWQMPHFYAIALRRYKEYAQAGLPTIVSIKGKSVATTDSLIYTVLFVLSLAMLFVVADFSIWFIVPIGYSLYWLWRMYILRSDYAVWPKKVFAMSLIMLILWSGFIGLEGFLT